MTRWRRMKPLYDPTWENPHPIPPLIHAPMGDDSISDNTSHNEGLVRIQLRGRDISMATLFIGPLPYLLINYFRKFFLRKFLYKKKKLNFLTVFLIFHKTNFLKWIIIELV